VSATGKALVSRSLLCAVAARAGTWPNECRLLLFCPRVSCGHPAVGVREGDEAKGRGAQNSRSRRSHADRHAAPLRRIPVHSLLRPCFPCLCLNGVPRASPGGADRRGLDGRRRPGLVGRASLCEPTTAQPTWSKAIVGQIASSGAGDSSQGPACAGRYDRPPAAQLRPPRSRRRTGSAAGRSSKGRCAGGGIIRYPRHWWRVSESMLTTQAFESARTVLRFRASAATPQICAHVRRLSVLIVSPAHFS
jgi:hypothetical protein